MRILAISGSLRAASINTALMNAAAVLAPENVEVIVFGRLGDLPHFNPDLDRAPAPIAVGEFRSQLRESAGVIISSPEYAHGVPGVLKNALDWLVASGELYEKPVALFSASPRATYAQASLTETLNVMMAKVLVESSITLALQGRGLDAGGVVSDPDACGQIRSALVTFVHSIARGAGMDLPDPANGGQPGPLPRTLSLC